MFLNMTIGQFLQRANCIEPLRGKRTLDRNITAEYGKSEVDVHTDKMTVLELETTPGKLEDTCVQSEFIGTSI